MIKLKLIPKALLGRPVWYNPPETSVQDNTRYVRLLTDTEVDRMKGLPEGTTTMRKAIEAQKDRQLPTIGPDKLSDEAHKSINREVKNTLTALKIHDVANTVAAVASIPATIVAPEIMTPIFAIQGAKDASDVLSKEEKLTPGDYGRLGLDALFMFPAARLAGNYFRFNTNLGRSYELSRALNKSIRNTELSERTIENPANSRFKLGDFEYPYGYRRVQKPTPTLNEANEVATSTAGNKLIPRIQENFANTLPEEETNVANWWKSFHDYDLSTSGNTYKVSSLDVNPSSVLKPQEFLYNVVDSPNGVKVEYFGDGYFGKRGPNSFLLKNVIDKYPGKRIYLPDQYRLESFRLPPGYSRGKASNGMIYIEPIGNVRRFPTVGEENYQNVALLRMKKENPEIYSLILEDNALNKSTFNPDDPKLLKEIAELLVKEKRVKSVDEALEALKDLDRNNTAYGFIGSKRYYVSPEYDNPEIKLHELEHAYHVPEQEIPSGVIEKYEDYFNHSNNTEMAARTGLILNWLGITDRTKTPLTEDMFKFMLKQYGKGKFMNNNMLEFFSYIRDVPQYLKWANNPRNVLGLTPFIYKSVKNNKEN